MLSLYTYSATSPTDYSAAEYEVQSEFFDENGEATANG